MPSWKLHEKWATRMGISEKICKEVNELIDNPKKWLNKRRKDTNIRSVAEFTVNYMVYGKSRFHDIRKSDKRLYERSYVLEYTYKIFGLEGVRAAVLHYILDKIVSMLKFYGFRVENDLLMARLKYHFRDLLEYYSNSDNLELQMFSKVTKEVFAFVLQNIDEIRHDLICDITI